MTPVSTISERLERFKSDLGKYTADTIVDRHIIFGDSYILEKDLYFSLKQEIASHFAIHPPEVLMVGSGKLGFSIAATKRYREFCDTSDLDIALVSPYLFDGIWEQVFTSVGKIGYWPEATQYAQYLSRGWIRPDKLPPARSFAIADDWWRFFESLAASGKYGRMKIRGGLYRNWVFLKGYQRIAVEACQSSREFGK